MYENKKIQNLDDFFVTLDKRKNNAVFFYRINGYNEKIKNFIIKYYEYAKKNGVVIEGGIPNPTEDNISFFGEMMGSEFRLEKEFIDNSMAKWLPRMKPKQRDCVANAVYKSLASLKNIGKNENMLKNSYIKFMCWLYYRFESVVNRLGNNEVPKILYEGTIGRYELLLISILCGAGCDVVLLQYNGDSEYLKLDSKSIVSNELKIPDMTAFPNGFSLDFIRKEMCEREETERLYGLKPSVLNCTNAWLSGNVLEDIKQAPVTRGDDKRLFYNCFCRMYGVEDKITYQNEIYRFYLEIKNSGRNFLIMENTIPIPNAEEVAWLRKGNYTSRNQMIADLSSRLKYPPNSELERLMVKAFIDVILEEAQQDNMNLNKLTNKAVYIICWLLRYTQVLFRNWQMPFVSVFIYLGGCKNENEALFLKMLSKLPCDILILVPNLNTKCILEDKTLFELQYNQSLNLSVFPTENSGLQIATAAYHAERELDEIMYNDSGMYRNFQYNKANSVTLKTMYEEIAILWDQDLKFRPNFSTVDTVVNVPVLFAKVSGVKDGLVPQYWQSIKQLMTEDTLVITSVPYIHPQAPNPMKMNSTEYFKNGKVQKQAIMRSPYYRYGVLREEIQNHILDKLQTLIDLRIINGTFVNGMEYNIVATVLNIQTDLLRLIQKFDFTKKNPKVIYINTTELVISQEDAILMAFLNLIGFDVVFFVPTGYQTVEKHYTRSIMDEHQVGEYMYDLQVPNLGIPSGGTVKGTKKSKNWIQKIFQKGK